MQTYFQDVRLETFAFALSAAYEKIAQKLHLDLFVAGARTTLAAPAAGVERKCACGQPLRHRLRSRSKQFTDAIEHTERQIDVDSFEIVLPGASDLDR